MKKLIFSVEFDCCLEETWYECRLKNPWLKKINSNHEPDLAVTARKLQCACVTVYVNDDTSVQPKPNGFIVVM